jgi:hypothetical protein
MQIWLILAVVGTAPIHVGNFPDMDTCQAAAMSNPIAVQRNEIAEGKRPPRCGRRGRLEWRAPTYTAALNPPSRPMASTWPVRRRGAPGSSGEDGPGVLGGTGE